MTSRNFPRPHHSGIIWVLTALLAIFTAWAAEFEIDQAVRAQGQVIPSARTQIIQAADGGVLKDIRVQEGQAVKQGELLAVLEKERSRAAVDEGRAKIAGQKAALERLRAETEDRPLVFDAVTEKRWPEFVRAQRGLYAQRKAALDAELSGLDRVLALARNELAMHQRLLDGGDVSQVEVMRIERQVIELETRRRGALDKYHSEARQEIVRIEEERASARYRLDEKYSVLKHTEITAPMDGIVKYIRLTTVGGVLRQGDEMMQISPVDEENLVEVKVNPADIGQLSAGLPATIRLDAFDSSIFGTLAGKLIYISPDTLSEQGAGGQQQIYYRAHVRVDWGRQPVSARIKASELKPGMAATVDILTGTRSVLTYLFKPIHKAFSGALIEK